MAIGDIIVGVDIGTTKVATVVGEVNNFGQIEIISNTSYKCNGLKKGKIISEDEISLSLAKTIKDAEDETNLKINSAYVTIPGKYATIVQNSITKEVKDKYSGISIRDVQSAMMQVKDIEVPDGKTLIDIVPDKITLENGTAFLATHSNAASVCGWARNLTDGQIRQVADCGGVVGLNFCADFVGSDHSSEGQRRGLLAHAKAIVAAGGEDVLAIGSDFDGIPPNQFLPSPASMPRFLEDLAGAIDSA